MAWFALSICKFVCAQSVGCSWLRSADAYENFMSAKILDE